MLSNLKRNLYFTRLNFLYHKGLKDGSITFFDEEFYEKMGSTYFNTIPVSIHIKYLKPLLPPGKCYDRNLYMFLCFDDALLVRGDCKYLELEYGKDSSRYGWIEIDDYVYDPSLLMRFEKDIFYKIYLPTNVERYTKEEYINKNREFYEKVKNTAIEDFMPNGKKRHELCVTIPLLQSIAELSTNSEFKKDLDNYLELIKYDEKSVFEEMNKTLKKLF